MCKFSHRGISLFKKESIYPVVLHLVEVFLFSKKLVRQESEDMEFFVRVAIFFLQLNS